MSASLVIEDRSVATTLFSLRRQAGVFIAGGKAPRNAWFHAGPLSLYLRRSRRFNLARDTLRETLDVAVIDVEQAHQGRGIFTAVLDFLEAHTRRQIFVENVLGTSNENQARIVNFLTRRGYALLPGDSISPCFLREPS
jgi:GNAT superfamily N-acetyltransferase